MAQWLSHKHHLNQHLHFLQFNLTHSHRKRVYPLTRRLTAQWKGHELWSWTSDCRISSQALKSSGRSWLERRDEARDVTPVIIKSDQCLHN